LAESVFFAGAAFGGSHYPQVFADSRRIVKPRHRARRGSGGCYIEAWQNGVIFFWVCRG
jgi:hypothetical protein